LRRWLSQPVILSVRQTVIDPSNQRVCHLVNQSFKLSVSQFLCQFVRLAESSETHDTFMATIPSHPESSKTQPRGRDLRGDDSWPLPPQGPARGLGTPGSPGWSRPMGPPAWGTGRPQAASGIVGSRPFTPPSPHPRAQRPQLCMECIVRLTWGRSAKEASRRRKAGGGGGTGGLSPVCRI